MAGRLVFSVQDAHVRYADKVIFEELTFNILEGEKICLIGKNGAGKSTLMNIVTGARELDHGTSWQLPGTTIGYLKQEIQIVRGQTVYDYVFGGLKEENQSETHAYKVEKVLQPLELHIRDTLENLSGGQLRRVALARALVEEPDILLLDEPTNHLDLDVIQWLEKYVRSYRGAVVCVSHDKAFLSAISDKVFWLDRGRLRTCPRGFAFFEEWQTMILEQEERELANRQKVLDMEVEWASRGVKARRKRNVRRLELMKEEREKLKADKSSFRKMMSKIELDPLDYEEGSSKIVAEFYQVNKKFVTDHKEKIIFDRFNFRILRGDRIGILGKNGSGKTTFIKMILGEEQPDTGKVKLARDIHFSYFDQKRRDLHPEYSLTQILSPNGGEYIDVMGKTRHVFGYLKDFMFDPKMAHQPVSTLSGGQKNRLMLARILANPGSFLILDEPTNDLDMDTLDMLEEILSQYKGTLVVVSHDRDFLDQTVTKILAFEGDGKLDGAIGGYSDYLAQKKAEEKERLAAANPKKNATASKVQNTPSVMKKLSYKLQFELDNLPAEIEALNQKITVLERILDDAELYSRDPVKFKDASAQLQQAQRDLDHKEHRWLELEEMRSSLN